MSEDGSRRFSAWEWAIFALFLAVMIAPAARVLARADEPPAWRVIDGDTIEIDGRTWRLIGVDTPEVGTQYGAECEAEIERGREATAHARALFEAAALIETRQREEGERDLYGRSLGFILLDGEDLGETMVADGFAKPWDYDGGDPKPDWCS